MLNKGKLAFATIALVLGFLAAGSVAMADPITGAFSMEGAWTPIPPGGIMTAIGISFNTNGLGGTLMISNSPITGDFAAHMVAGDVGDIQDLIFNPFAGTIIDFFIVNDVAFDLTGISVELQNDDFLILKGTGIFKIPGFDDTAGVWNWTGQTVTGSGTFSWSASAGAEGSPIPEPTTLSLLGLGLAGAALFIRRKIS